MKLEYIPLLAIQRDLYRIPRGIRRFGAYARLMRGDHRDDSRVAPLVAMNPMARDHVPALLDDLLGLDAERVGSEAAFEAASHLAEGDATLKVGLVVADDLGGGWTNRYASEFAWISGSPAALRPGWIAGVLWSSESASAKAVRESILVALYRADYVQRNGKARTLREFMDQEGHSLGHAGCDTPTLDAEDLDDTRALLAPLLDVSLARTIMECLYGDEAARTLGFTPRGLSHRAGLALALSQAKPVA